MLWRASVQKATAQIHCRTIQEGLENKCVTSTPEAVYQVSMEYIPGQYHYTQYWAIECIGLTNMLFLHS